MSAPPRFFCCWKYCITGEHGFRHVTADEKNRVGLRDIRQRKWKSAIDSKALRLAAAADDMQNRPL